MDTDINACLLLRLQNKLVVVGFVCLLVVLLVFNLLSSVIVLV